MVEVIISVVIGAIMFICFIGWIIGAFDDIKWL